MMFVLALLNGVLKGYIFMILCFGGLRKQVQAAILGGRLVGSRMQSQLGACT